MKMRLAFVAAIALAGFGAADAIGGHPMWPPCKHTAEYRQANMVFLRFQDALAAMRWDEALGMSSDRVRSSAAAWSSAEQFFQETVPVDLLLAQDFGYWMSADGFYGLLVPLTEPGSNPFVQWYWAIRAAKGSWVVDFPSVKLDEYVARKKAAIQAREAKKELMRRSLEPKLAGIKTRLVPLTERFAVGSPMLFRVELKNVGDSAVDYMDDGIAFGALTVLHDRRPLPSQGGCAGQICVRQGKVAAGATVVLADKIDIGRLYAITDAGTYTVQFSGERLAIGQPVPGSDRSDPGMFGENEGEISCNIHFLAATNRFASDPIEIKVMAEGNR